MIAIGEKMNKRIKCVVTIILVLLAVFLAGAAWSYFSIPTPLYYYSPYGEIRSSFCSAATETISIYNIGAKTLTSNDIKIMKGEAAQKFNLSPSAGIVPNTLGNVTFDCGTTTGEYCTFRIWIIARPTPISDLCS